MKNLILALTMIFAAQAGAEQLTAELNVVRIQPQSSLSHLNIENARALVDTDNREITLFLTPLLTKTVKLDTVYTDGCGSTVYAGSHGGNFPDAIHTGIEVRDNTSLRCRILLPATQVNLKISGGLAGFNETHEMESAALHARMLQAELNTFEFQSGSVLAGKRIREGKIVIDRAYERITLMLYPASNCPAGVMCIAVVPPPVVIDLPLIEVRQYRCGITKYISSREPVGHGGAIHELTVTDNSLARCGGSSDSAVQVELKVLGFIPELHVMTGPARLE